MSNNQDNLFDISAYVSNENDLKNPRNNSKSNHYLKKAQEVKDLDQAFILFNKLIKKDSQNVLAHYQKGVIQDLFYRLTKDAIETFSKVIDIDPDFYPAWYSRGICKKKLEDFKGALDDYDQSIKKYDSNAISEFSSTNFLYNAFNNRGNVKSKLKDYTSAIDDFNFAIEQFSEDKKKAEVFSNRAIAYQELGEYKFALLDYEKALSINPDFCNCYVNRGNLLMQLGFYFKARQDFQKVIFLDKNFEFLQKNIQICSKKIEEKETLLMNKNC